MATNSETTRIPVSFLAIDPYIERHIPSPVERNIPGKNMVEWGENNAFPNYLLELSQEAPTLRSIIGGTADFICGDGCTIKPLDTDKEPGIMNTRGDVIDAQVRDNAIDLITYGGFALQVIRSASGDIVEVYYIDVRFLRCNKDNAVFYYSEKWGRPGRRDTIVYPAFMRFTPEQWAALTDEQKNFHASSILYVKTTHTQTYPLPVYCAALKACETERAIADYHLNAINNCFTSSMIINFNNGKPSEEQKEEIESSVNEKFSGTQNAMRIMLSFNEGKENATTIETPKVEDFGERYKALAQSVRQQQFTAFRANPNLFGIPTENLGFSQEEYEAAFRLFNRTVVRPFQRLICDAYDRIYGDTGVLTITPFSLEETATEKQVN